MSKISIVGLGPGEYSLISQGALDALHSSCRIYLRTEKHPIVNKLKETIEYTSLDNFYDSEENFEDVYYKISKHIIDLAKEGDLVYAVPGHPRVAEKTVGIIEAMAKEKNLVVQYVDKNKLDEISTSHAHQGVIAQVSEYKYYELDELIASAKEKSEHPFFIILDEITDPHNLGTIIRTADAVGAHGVIIPKRRSVHITPVVAKASAGAVEYVPVCKVTNIVNTIKKLKEEGLWIAAADMDGQTFYEQNLTGALGLVIGSEGFGISRLVKQNCDFTVKMPMIGNVTSLNASVAGGILLYEIFRQRTGKK